MLRLVRTRSPQRPADVLVEPSSRPEPGFCVSDEAPVTRPSGPGHMASADASDESIRDDELVFASIEDEPSSPEKTPVTIHSPWQRNIPPPLPGQS